MNMSRMFQSLASLAVAGLFIIGQQALAQDSHRLTRLALPDKSNSGTASFSARSDAAPAPNIYGLQATLTQINPKEGPNADGTDLWPCFGYGSAFSNPDCPTVGNPSIPFPVGGIVVGTPQYVWKLANNTGYGYGNGDGNGNGCDALINGTTGPHPAQYRPCGQIATWYEDDTNDSTDDLLQHIVVRQGDRIIYDSGTVDYGPAGPSVTYPVSVILNTDANLGYWPGAAVGPDNGNCSANVGYPLTSPTFPAGTVFVVASGQACQRPTHGKATFTTETMLATPRYIQATGAGCKGGASPCYRVEWFKNYETHQDFDIFLE
jgi:hypothetical protein